MTYTPAKLALVASVCGSTVDPITLAQLLNDPRQTPASIAAILSTTPVWFMRAMALPEPVTYAPMSSSNV